MSAPTSESHHEPRLRTSNIRIRVGHPRGRAHRPPRRRVGLRRRRCRQDRRSLRPSDRQRDVARAVTSRDRGQATVELALVLPLVLVVLLGCLQVVEVLVEQVRLVHVVRDGARAAAVSAEPEVAARAVTGAQRIRLDVTSTDTTVEVTGWADVRTDVPLIGRLIPDITLRERLTMTLELP
ncbi:MAG: hypothetical protein FGM29_06325 [Actinobacteria bacterium]|nr:hypothetical protein [Actinomycetota bacterium]